MPLQFGAPEEYGFPSPRDGQVPKSWHADIGGHTNYTFYTVPAGKVVYVTMVSVATVADDDVDSHPYFGNAADVIVRFRMLGISMAAVNFYTPVKFSAGMIVKAWFDDDDDAISVVGWEEDAA